VFGFDVNSEEHKAVLFRVEPSGHVTQWKCVAIGAGTRKLNAIFEDNPEIIQDVYAALRTAQSEYQKQSKDTPSGMDVSILRFNPATAAVERRQAFRVPSFDELPADLREWCGSETSSSSSAS
jgi:20S proteasome alpha/beta subunit